MKVGIASCYNHHNYGSMLQAYATQKIVQKLGAEPVTIACHRPIEYMTQPKVTYYFHKVANVDIMKGKLRLIISRLKEKKYSEVVSGREIRRALFDDFSQKYFILSEMNASRDSLTRFAKTCDAVMVGSDQLWNPINVEHNYYTLTFVPDEIKKISYATSIGSLVIPPYQKEEYVEFLSRFDSISVREDSAAKTLHELGVEKEISVVLDPTLLFTADDWMEIQRQDAIVKDKYILCYFLGVNEYHRCIAEKIKRLTGYKIVALQHLDEFVEKDISFGDMHLYEVGPSEFVNLIRNAEYVCTDSFHGTCFSIIYHKKFLTFNRYSSSNTQSTNSRIDSLFNMLGLWRRKVNADITSKELNEIVFSDIDYDIVDSKLNEMRKYSIDFLNNALFGQKD